MDLAHKLLAVTTTLLLAAGAFFSYNWLRAHDDYVRAAAQVKSDHNPPSRNSPNNNPISTRN